MDEQPFTLCPGCNQRVDPDEPRVIYAVELKRIDTLRGFDYVEGMGAVFHEGHFPHSSGRWRQKPPP
jgi:hypothetical protein